MTEKYLPQFLLVIISILMLTSCLVSTNSNDSNMAVDEVFGEWNITEASLKRLKSEDEKTRKRIISSFQLNSDSTARVSFVGSEKRGMDGTWAWQAEKKVGKSKFNISLKSDVVIRVQGLYTLALQISEEKGTNKLMAGDYTFAKQKQQ